ncbi:hypothetical protein, variant [Verruconis gallopava]|uniref:C2H2-type domain-containing protein n=1 Tax=Verruconis gallopava TaxID=253628 RepID=A0A0D1ZZ71_9PEZI|nr:hypothetical protein, variant [Verruconis gallopava]KIV99732.1 hypothetical protein, variant [Verruconis gallopava]
MTGGKRTRVVGAPDAEIDPAESSSDESSAEELPGVQSPKKRIQLDATESGKSSGDRPIRCSLPPHDEMEFDSYEAYETHFEQQHRYRCSECCRNFPSDHYLQLHIAENHDPITAVKRERGEKTFACFVEDCERKCSTAQKRRMHMIDKHGFPKVSQLSLSYHCRRSCTVAVYDEQIRSWHLIGDQLLITY